MPDMDMRTRMLTIGYANNGKSVKDILHAGYDLGFTHQLDDMSDPAKTIYTVTGADYCTGTQEAMRNGYLNSSGQPLELYSNRGLWPLAINSPLYLSNFALRLAYLREYTKWPFGLHIGGSKNLIEHTYPIGIGHSKDYWCYGFKKTHKYDDDITLAQYQVDVWEDVTNEMIQMAQKVFPTVKVVTTSYPCPASTVTKKGITTMSCGSEIWYMLKRMSLIHRNWYNIFFDSFNNIENSPDNRFMDLSAALSSYGIRRNIIVGLSDNSALIGGPTANICREGKMAGGGYLAYMVGLHGGIIVNEPIGIDISKKIDAIKKYNI